MPSPVVTLTPEEYVTRLRELAGDYSSSASASVGVSVSSPGSPYAAKAPASPQLTSPSGRFLGSGLHRFHSPVPSPARATSGNDVLGASALGSGSPLRGSGSQLAPSSPSGNDLNRSTSSALSRSTSCVRGRACVRVR